MGMLKSLGVLTRDEEGLFPQWICGVHVEKSFERGVGDMVKHRFGATVVQILANEPYTTNPRCRCFSLAYLPTTRTAIIGRG